MRSYMTPYADQNITQEVANRRLPLDKVVVGWYSNRRVLKSVVHSHPYRQFGSPAGRWTGCGRSCA